MLALWHFLLLPVLADSARVEAGRLVVEPTGISFEIPSGWLSRTPAAEGSTCDSNSAQARSVNTNPVALRSLTGPSSYYGDQYYSALADSVFVANDLVAHLGARGWRDCDSSADDLQMRVYITDASVAESSKRLPAVRLSPFAGYSAPKLAAPRDSAGWHIEHLNWIFNCGDCTFPERFEIYSRRVGTRTVSLVFMCMPEYGIRKDSPSQRILDMQAILNSFLMRQPQGL